MFFLDKRFANEIIAHAREEAPNECCGILAGTPGRALQLYRTTNALHSSVRYNVEPKELLRIHLELDGKGWEIVAIYHSHTHSHAYPSATDVQLAFWTDSLYLIVSLQEPARPVIRAFRIHKGQIAEEELKIGEAEPLT